MPKTVKIIVIDTGAPKGEAGKSLVAGEPAPRDLNGHAAKVAGIIRARAPQARLVFIKAVPKSGHGSPNDLANALFAAAAERPDIVNVSLAVPRGEPRLRRAVRALRAAGALVVCGAGNDPAKGVQWPARYPETVSVGALGADGRTAPFSPDGCDLMLQGVRVPVRVRGRGMAHPSGTSIACAVATGLLAAAMASGAKDALETIRNSLKLERKDMSLKSKLKTKLGKLIDKWLGKLFGRLPAENPVSEPEPAPPRDPGQTPAADADDVDFNALDWCWGGFGGGGATPADGCRISNLRVGGGKLSYDWADGSCAPLGEGSRGDAVCIAALFCLGEDGKWRGGKFEWIGTSRTSRSLGNCDGYHGWQMSAVDAAQAYAFVIVSRNGKARSNVIVQGV